MKATRRTRTRADGTSYQSETYTVCYEYQGRRHTVSTDARDERAALRVAKDHRDAVIAGRHAELTRWRIRGTLTLAELAREWFELGAPRANRIPRDARELPRVHTFLDSALKWWGGIPAGGVKPLDFERHLEAVRTRARAHGRTGDRMADQELNALANLTSWALATGRIEADPFAKRPRFQQAKDVRHCHTFMPSGAEELHSLARAMIVTGPRGIVSAAQLLLCALTGLRPGEPGALRWDAPPEAPGHRYTATRDGQAVELMYVHRSKGGINPAVRLHAALADLLEAWRRYTAVHWPSVPWIFPDPTRPDRPLVPAGDRAALTTLSRTLHAAARTLGLPTRHPHGMRAYYVRVRRAMGIDDATIATELGQGSGPALVVTVYGDPRGVVGDGRYGWTPAEAAPAWADLDAAASNIIALPR